MDIAGGQTPVRVMFALIDGDRAEAERILVASPRADFKTLITAFTTRRRGLKRSSPR